MKFICPILITFLLLSSCAEEQGADQNSVQRLNISFADTPTRSNWNDQTDTENKVNYIWDESNTNMLTAIKHGSQYVPFYESMN